MRPLKPILFVACVGVLVLLGYFVSKRFAEQVAVPQDSKQEQHDTLIVRGQLISGTVTVERVVLSQGGFLVLRNSDGKRIGQIIEISQYLTAGAHENVQVPLGDFYEYDGSDQPIVVVYRDDGDATFSVLDQPAVNLGGTMWGMFVISGASVPPAVFAQEVASSNGMSMETVFYTNVGFSPVHLTLPLGTMVEFINQSDVDMWVASNVHPSHEILPTFDQFTRSSRDTSYMYTFDKKGTWKYHDHINPAREGVIVVE